MFKVDSIEQSIAFIMVIKKFHVDWNVALGTKSSICHASTLHTFLLFIACKHCDGKHCNLVTQWGVVWLILLLKVSAIIRFSSLSGLHIFFLSYWWRARIDPPQTISQFTKNVQCCNSKCSFSVVVVMFLLHFLSNPLGLEILFCS